MSLLSTERTHGDQHDLRPLRIRAVTKVGETATTTLDALRAAQWTRIGYGTWELSWADHTQYVDAVPEDDDAEWMCQLTREDGEWVYDFEHDHRGGPQDRNGLDVSGDASVDEAQAACKRGLENWIQRWTDSAEEDRQQSERDAEDGDDQD